jgi:hypothetical protein
VVCFGWGGGVGWGLDILENWCIFVATGGGKSLSGRRSSTDRDGQKVRRMIKREEI